LTRARKATQDSALTLGRPEQANRQVGYVQALAKTSRVHLVFPGVQAFRTHVSRYKELDLLSNFICHHREPEPNERTGSHFGTTIRDSRSGFCRCDFRPVQATLFPPVFLQPAYTAVILGLRIKHPMLNNHRPEGNVVGAAIRLVGVVLVYSPPSTFTVGALFEGVRSFSRSDDVHPLLGSTSRAPNPFLLLLFSTVLVAPFAWSIEPFGVRG